MRLRFRCRFYRIIYCVLGIVIVWICRTIEGTAIIGAGKVFYGDFLFGSIWRGINTPQPSPRRDLQSC